MLYAVTAQAETSQVDKMGKWAGSRQVPTFYVDAPGPGEATLAAREVLHPAGEVNAVHLAVAPVPADQIIMFASQAAA